TAKAVGRLVDEGLQLLERLVVLADALEAHAFAEERRIPELARPAQELVLRIERDEQRLLLRAERECGRRAVDAEGLPLRPACERDRDLRVDLVGLARLLDGTRHGESLLGRIDRGAQDELRRSRAEEPFAEEPVELRPARLLERGLQVRYA